MHRPKQASVHVGNKVLWPETTSKVLIQVDLRLKEEPKSAQVPIL